MFQPDPYQRRMGISHSILPPHFIGGMTRSRHDAALAADVEQQAAQRAAIAALQAKGKVRQILWSVLVQAVRRAAGVVWRPHSRFEIERLIGVLK
jgi:hypothetical protein